MKMAAVRKEASWEDLGDWIDTADARSQSDGTSIQTLRLRMVRVFGWQKNAEMHMRSPHFLLNGDTPWDALYYVRGGARRISSLLDLIDQGRLELFPSTD